MNLCNMWNQCRSIVILFSAFTFLFAIMEPVPWQLKIAFHFFGFGSLILGMVLFASTFASELCVSVFFLLFFYGNLRVKKYSLTPNNSNLLGRPKKVWVIRNSSARQITGNRERSKWMGNGEGMQVSCTLYFKGSIGWHKNCYFEKGIKQQILINI